MSRDSIRCRSERGRYASSELLDPTAGTSPASRPGLKTASRNEFRMFITRLLLKDRSWFLLLSLILVVLLSSSVKWILDHPCAVSWDEASYFNTVLADQAALRVSGLRGLRTQILYDDRGRPPAFRLIAIPFHVVFGFSPVKMRLVSLGFHCASLVLLFLTTRKIASPKCAVLSVLVFCLSPDVVFASALFYTEYPLFLATTGAFYFFVSSLKSGSEARRNWIGLGLSTGLGLMAKASFLLIAAPLLGFVLIARRISGLSGPPPLVSIKAGLLASLIAGPWWFKNYGPALNYARVSRYDMYITLGEPSLRTWMFWLLTVVQSLLGYGVTIILILVLLSWTWYCFSPGSSRLDSIQRSVLLACGSAMVPLILGQLLGTNHQLRLLCPILVPMAISFGLLASVSGWDRLTALLSITCLALLSQLAMLVYPVFYPNTTVVGIGYPNARFAWRALARFDQWDWRPLREVSRSYGFEEPTISLIGSGRNLNALQIVYPWAVEGNMKTSARHLWQNNKGPIDWTRVMKVAAESDIVLTAPHWLGELPDRPHPDNLHNFEFDQRMARDPRFRGPIHLRMGRFEPVEVNVFVRLRRS